MPDSVPKNHTQRCRPSKGKSNAGHSAIAAAKYQIHAEPVATAFNINDERSLLAVQSLRDRGLVSLRLSPSHAVADPRLSEDVHRVRGVVAQLAA